MSNAAAAAVPKPALPAWIPRVAAWIAGIAMLLFGAANLAVRGVMAVGLIPTPASMHTPLPGRHRYA